MQQAYTFRIGWYIHNTISFYVQNRFIYSQLQQSHMFVMQQVDGQDTTGQCIFATG